MRFLLVALVLIAARPGIAAAQRQEAQPSVLVRAEPLRHGSLDLTIAAYGLVQAAPGATLDLSMPRAGQVLGLRVVSGERVTAGDPLFEYGPEPAELLAYQQALSASTLARQELGHTQSLFAQRLATQSQLDQGEKGSERRGGPARGPAAAGRRSAAARDRAVKRLRHRDRRNKRRSRPGQCDDPPAGPSRAAAGSARSRG